jgi:TetR/AcrR family transcriptional regulator
MKSDATGKRRKRAPAPPPRPRSGVEPARRAASAAAAAPGKRAASQPQPQPQKQKQKTQFKSGARAPGRPSGGSAAHREALLDAARLVFARTGFAASSLRAIAGEARVTPALTHYYFADKAGLLTAVIEERVAPLVQRIAAAIHGAGDDPEAAMTAFVRAYTRTAAEHPWLPQLILKEVLSDGGTLRERFITLFASGIAGLLKAKIGEGQKRGAFRRDVEPARVVMSTISLCIFPFIAAPLVSTVLGVRVDPSAADALAGHHLSILLSGIKE